MTTNAPHTPKKRTRAIIFLVAGLVLVALSAVAYISLRP